MMPATFEGRGGTTAFGGAARAGCVRHAVVLAALLLAGCADEAGPAEQGPASPAEQLYLGGGAVDLDEDTGGASLWVEVGGNVTALSMELVYTAVGSIDPRVYGLPDCEWRLFTTYTETRSDTIDCATVAPGRHEIRVEHDGGQLHMVVRVLGRVAAEA